MCQQFCSLFPGLIFTKVFTELGKRPGIYVALSAWSFLQFDLKQLIWFLFVISSHCCRNCVLCSSC